MNPVTIHRKRESILSSKEKMKLTIQKGNEDIFPMFNKTVLEI